MYKVVQIWPGLFVCKQVTVCPGHIWTTLNFDTNLAILYSKIPFTHYSLLAEGNTKAMWQFTVFQESNYF
jgi:hypothetical protein